MIHCFEFFNFRHRIVRTTSPNLPAFALLVLARPSSAVPVYPLSLKMINSKHGDKLDSEILSNGFNIVAEQVMIAAGMRERWPVNQTESSWFTPLTPSHRLYTTFFWDLRVGFTTNDTQVCN